MGCAALSVLVRVHVKVPYDIRSRVGDRSGTLYGPLVLDEFVSNEQQGKINKIVA